MEGARDPKNNSIIMEKAGIIPRSINYIFNNLEENKAEYTLKVSCLELYNEELHDLLSQDSIILTGDKKSKKIRIYDDPKKGTLVTGLEDVTVRQASDVMQLLDQASAKRAIAETQMNALSSRSHVITTVTIHIREIKSDGEEIIKTGKLNLVDLAGSENIGRSGAINNRAKEAGKINQSLLTLGRVITSLTEGRPHVPYRESKLTRLLQDALGGKSKTCIIATISPSSLNLEETLSTLEYAHTAKSIKNKPEINAKYSKLFLMKELSGDLENLKNELRAQREKNGVYLPFDQYEKIIEESKRSKIKIDELSHEIEQLSSERDDFRENLENEQMIHKLTQKNLQEKEILLEDVTQQFNQISNELQKTEFILDATKRTESLLLIQAEDLKNQLYESIQEVEGLRQKITRHEKLEANNSILVSNFNVKNNEDISSIDSLVSKFSTNQFKFLQNFKDSVNLHWRTCFEKSINNIKQKSKEALSCQKRQLENITQLINSFSLSDQDAIRAIQNEMKDSVLNLITNSSSDFAKASNQLYTLLNDINNQIQIEIQSNITQYITTIEQKMNEFIKEQNNEFLKIESQLKNNISQRVDSFSIQQKILQELKEEQFLSRNKIKEVLLSNLDELFLNQEMVLNKKVVQIHDTLGDQIIELQQLQNSIVENLEDIQSKSTALHNSSIESTKKMKKDFGNQSKKSEEIFTNLQNYWKIINKLWSQDCNEIADIVDNSNKEVINLTENQTSKWKLLKEEYSDKKIDFTTQMDIIQEDQENNIKNMISNYFEAQIMKDVNSHYDEGNNSMKEFCIQAQNKFNEIQSSRNRFINEFEPIYKSFGKTPQKTNHIIPETFYQTESREQLLEKFENKLNNEENEYFSSGERTPLSSENYDSFPNSPKYEVLKPRAANIPQIQSPQGKRNQNSSLRRKQPDTPKSATPRAKRRRLKEDIDLETLPR